LRGGRRTGSGGGCLNRSNERAGAWLGNRHLQTQRSPSGSKLTGEPSQERMRTAAIHVKCASCNALAIAPMARSLRATMSVLPSVTTDSIASATRSLAASPHRGYCRKSARSVQTPDRTPRQASMCACQ
jgi:hypothetical protein